MLIFNLNNMNLNALTADTSRLPGSPSVRLDLHRHLEGSHSPAALLAVAEQFHIDTPPFFDPAQNRFRTRDELERDLVLHAPSDDASLFYGCISKARVAYVSVAAISELARLAFLEAAHDTDGFEMRMSLFSMTRTLLDNEGTRWRELHPAAFADRAEKVLAAVITARNQVVAQAGKPILIRLGFSRTFESETHYRAMAAMLKHHRQDLCGLDVLGIVSGPDKEPMPAALRAILCDLRTDIPDLTVHAGEFEDHQSVLKTLDLEPEAIGHGVHSVGCDATLERLATTGVTLEVCPSSNRLLIPSALTRLQAHHGRAPLPVLQHAGVHCVLGSDDPVPMGTSFSNEWEVALSMGCDLTQLQRDIERRWAQINGHKASESVGYHRS